MGRARPTGSGDAPGRPGERRSRLETGAGPAAPAFPSPVSGVVRRLARGAGRFAHAAWRFAGASAARPEPALRAGASVLATVFIVPLLSAGAARAQRVELVGRTIAAPSVALCRGCVAAIHRSGRTKRLASFAGRRAACTFSRVRTCPPRRMAGMTVRRCRGGARRMRAPTDTADPCRRMYAGGRGN